MKPESVDDCCSAQVEAPTKPYNRPGEAALTYRAGTHGVFLRRMVARLPTARVPQDDEFAPQDAEPLRRLTARTTDDPVVALLDAWATCADVLTFYQERIANEGYLRTATESLSVRQLARAIGYELRPGAAASTYLAFTVEETPGAPREAEVPVGTRVQNIPVKDQLPQVFETVEPLTAQATWNALRPLRQVPPQIHIDAEQGHLTYSNGTSVQWPVQELLLAGRGARLKAGDLLLLQAASPPQSYLVTVVRTVEDAAADLTRVVIQQPRGTATGAQVWPSLHLEESATEQHVPAQSVPFSEEAVEQWVYDQALPEQDLAHLLVHQRWSAKEVLQSIAEIRQRRRAVEVTVSVLALRARVALFGHNAPRWESLPLLRPENQRGNPYPTTWEGRTIWTDSQGTARSPATRIYLERAVPEVLPGSWIILETASAQPGRPLRRVYSVDNVTELAVADYGLTGRVTAVDLVGERDERFLVRSTVAYAVSEPLTLADAPVFDQVDRSSPGEPTFSAPVGFGTAGATGSATPPLVRLPYKDHPPGEDAASDPQGGAPTRITLDQMVLGLEPGKPLTLRGERADAASIVVQELANVAAAYHYQGRTTLVLAAPLHYAYQRHSLVIGANVAPATHGETISEILGSGDGTAVGQRFVLKRPPLTYLASTGAEAASTLKIRVDDVLWTEVPALLDERPEREVFTIQREEGDLTVVQFGDGKRGSRLTSGQDNVVAVYRTGLGEQGNLGANTLTLLMARPPGLKDVANPLPATGGASPESLENAKRTAPCTVMNLGRIVSVNDYADFAAAYPGIGKSRARLVDRHPDGRPRPGETPKLLLLTVAGARGTDVPQGSLLQRTLTRAIDQARDPAQRRSLQVVVANHQRRLFDVRARVMVDPRHKEDAVLAAVRAALRATFSFELRDFAEPVACAEVVAVIQRVPGVIAAHIAALTLAPLVDDLGMQPLETATLSAPTIRRARFVAPLRTLRRVVTTLGPSAEAHAAVLSKDAQPNAQRLPAQDAGWDRVWEHGQWQWRLWPAQLVVINPDGITLEVMEPQR